MAAPISERIEGPVDACDDRVDLDAIVQAMRAHRVGGAFWARTAAVEREPRRIVRANDAATARTMLAPLGARHDRTTELFVFPREHWGLRAERACRRAGVAALVGEVDPWTILRPGVRVAAGGDDEWLLLAAIAGAEPEPWSAGRYVPQSQERMTHVLRRELVERVRYRDVFTGGDATVDDVVALLGEWRALIDRNRQVAVAAGIAWWKRREVGAMLWADRNVPLRFTRSTRTAVKIAAAAGGAIVVWPSRMPAGLEAAAATAVVPLHLVEDGFVRSVGLGSDLLPPWSIVIDRLGIYYDPTHESDLERILATAAFPDDLLARAERLAAMLVREGIGKYGRGARSAAGREPTARRRVLVVGQVEDDQSVRAGRAGVAGNLDLLVRARASEAGTELWFRPHPDVDAGHRRGAVPDHVALRHADRIVRGGSVATLLDEVDCVHVLTSLTGFEALLRHREVVVHGQPFYAGWGLTRDLAPPIARRGRALSVAMLVAGALILYPRYRDPVTGLLCGPEQVIDRIAKGRTSQEGWLTGLRRLQGKLRRRVVRAGWR